MGDDGHTASLFANAPEYAQAIAKNQQAAAIGIHPAEALHSRISLTLNRLLRSEQIIIYFTGEKKLDIFSRALDKNNHELLPIKNILLQQNVPVSVYYTN